MAPSMNHNDFPCVSCSEQAATREGQVAHLQTVHGADKPWLCYHCPTATNGMESLKAHHQQTHGKGFNQCIDRDCGLQLSTAETMARHTQHDHVEQFGRAIRGCTRCSYVNDSRIAASLHMLHRHPERCEYCQQTFRDEVELRVHKKQGFDGVCPKKLAPQAANASKMQYAARSPPLPLPVDRQDSAKNLKALLPPLARKPLPEIDQLPDFATIPAEQNMHNVTAADFDPLRDYADQKIHITRYRYCPPQVPDSRLLNADPNMLAYGNLLRLAKTMTSEEIFIKANQYRPKPVFESILLVDKRIKTAYQQEAKIWTDPAEGLFTDAEEVKNWLKEEKRRNGIENGRRIDRSVIGGPVPRHYSEC